MIAHDQLKAIIDRQRDNSLGDSDTDLSAKRADALKRYKGEVYGDELEGRSQVVSKDIAETVDYIMPQLMRTMLASGNVVEFDPIGPEDEALAEQESDYVNHVMLKQNSGFLYLHDWFKDGLILGNGYVKHYWEDAEKVRIERYAGLSDDELAVLLSREDQEAEIIEQEERQIEIPTEQGIQPVTVYDVKLRVTTTEGKVCIEAVPPSEVRLDRKLRGSIQKASYFEHCPRGVTRSDLIEMGMSKAFVDGLPAFNEDENTDEEEEARDIVNDSYEENIAADHSMDEIEYREVYIRVDADEDGKAELRKVVIAGDKIHSNEEVDAIPFTYISPKRMPHRHIGESMYDELKDIQRIKTTLQRQMLDNVYLINNSELILNERAQEYMDDYLVRTPGGVKRISGVEPTNGSVTSIAPPPLLGELLPAIDYIDQVRESRTGVGRNNAQIDPDVLKQSTAEAFSKALQQSNAKIEMIARMFAELGVKELALQVHKLLLQHQDKAAIVKLRGEYITIDPTEWKDRDDLTVNVGLGTGNVEEERANLREVSVLMEKLAGAGLVGPMQMFNLASDVIERMGFANPQRYVMSPQSPEYQQAMQAKQQPPQPTPDTMVLAQIEQGKMQGRLQEAQLKAQTDMQRDQIKHQHQMHQMQADMQTKQAEMLLKLRELMQKGDIATAQMEVDAFIAGASVDLGQPGIRAELGQRTEG